MKSSIKKRILLGLIPLTFAALSIAGYLVDGFIKRDIYEGLDNSLSILSLALASAVELHYDNTMSLSIGEDRQTEFDAMKVFYALRDTSGKVVASGGHGLPDSLPWTISPYGASFINANGKTYRILVTSYPVARDKEDLDDEETRRQLVSIREGREKDVRSVVVTLGQPTEAVEATLGNLRIQLLVFLLGLFAVLTLVPYIVISTALRPLKLLSRQADAVGPESPAKLLMADQADEEVKSLVTALNGALGRLSEAYEIQKTFTTNAAHDLRTPLSAIRAQCEVAFRRERSAGELNSILISIDKVSKRLGALVEKLLLLARVQAQGSFSSPLEVDLRIVVAEAIELHHLSAASKGVALLLGVEDEAVVTGHEALLTQAVSNLVENAVKYTPEGGKVFAGVIAHPCRAIYVRDSGIGIHPDLRRKIFDRFFKADDSRQTGEGGSGLGLAIVNEIARLHRASVEVWSEVGQGSEFRIVFRE